jgi:hypothetical protein
MTRAEYEEVCKKFPDYLNLTGSGTCYIKGAATFGLYEVTDIIYEGCVLDDKVIGKVWYKCYSPDKKTIQTRSKICYNANTKEECKLKGIEKDFE